MKKLILGLLIALGATNVYAAKSEQTDLQNRINRLQVPQEKKAGFIALINNNKAITAAVVVLALGGTAFTLDKYFNESKGYNAVAEFVANHGGSKVQGWYTPAKDKVVEYKKSIGIAATILAIIVVAYDLNKAEDKSALKKLYGSLMGNKNVA